jgi:hypothetical protein
LRASGNSHWENRYRKFADTSDFGRFSTWGQRNAATVIFAVLGLVIPFIAFRDGFEACLPPKQNCFPLWHWIAIFGFIEICYLGFILYVGPPRNYKKRLKKYISRWEAIMSAESPEATDLSDDILIKELERFSTENPTRDSRVDMIEFIESSHGADVCSAMRALSILYGLQESGRIRIVSEPSAQQKACRIVVILAG